MVTIDLTDSEKPQRLTDKMSTCSEHPSSESSREDDGPMASDTDSEEATSNAALQSFLSLSNYDELDQSILHNQSDSCDGNGAIDCDFSRIKLEAWRMVASPSSSLSSIHSFDEDCLEAEYNLEEVPYRDTASERSLFSTNQSSNCASMEEAVSIEEINARIGLADELLANATSSGSLSRGRTRPKLETIFEGQFLHTPPKSNRRSHGPANKSWSSGHNSLVERLERL